jgi:hypothetical protein
MPMRTRVEGLGVCAGGLNTVQRARVPVIKELSVGQAMGARLYASGRENCAPSWITPSPFLGTWEVLKFWRYRLKSSGP